MSYSIRFRFFIKMCEVQGDNPSHKGVCFT